MKEHALVLLTATAIMAVASCESGYWLLGTSEERAPCDGGRCVPAPPPGWQGPVLLWTGAPGEVPTCPASAPEQVYKGYIELIDEPRCPTCACGPAACQFNGVGLLDATSCDFNAPEVVYPAPEDWDGECISTMVIPEEQADFVHWRRTSLRPCVPEEIPDPVGWTIEGREIAIACGAAGAVSACDGAQVCAPAAASTPGFLSCVVSPGDHGCPPGHPNRHVVFDRIDPSTTGCTPCACQEPQGGECSISVSVHVEPACGGWGSTSGSVLHSEGCNGPLIPGASAVSISGWWVAREPGSCEPVPSVPTGAPVLASPTTFCCTE